ncbi:MAG TPA: hypothetical protein DE312_10720 [Gallionella sp.]|nr:helix-turn-helix transcriptional regulator [Gallionella sp.]OGS66862.1 MAG: hypothetical protein A2Z87_01210 [Gallionellales bacterium GWA2_54_124]OGT20771.1 MAG: hypothetical protein A2522_06055 [Gallionellales bacterium RIFOXYD12_FULL_53_10]HCI53768.1 hypothetical protein [Gallionella sp.]
MARPTFQINPQRLRGLRIEHGFTQKKLADKLNALLLEKNQSSNKPLKESSSPQTLLTTYQRIERNGKTSPERAAALATVLGVSVELLQGSEQPEPLDYLKRIKTLLTIQIENKENAALQRRFEQLAEEGNDDPLPYLVEEICEKIEAVQLERNPSEITELIELTGLPENELLKPANVLGHWFVTVKSYQGKKSYIFHDAREVSYQIQKKIDEHLSHFPLDSSIQMWRDGSWFRMEIKARQSMHIDFVRCHPDAKGLCWSPASWRDEFFLYDSFVNWSYSAANLITDFEGKQSPLNMQRLRLLVTENVVSVKDGPVVHSQRRMMISGRLDEIPESTKEGFLRESAVHNLYESWLITDLRYALMPHLTEHPSECWEISAHDGISIRLTSRRTRSKIIPDEIQYCITLVEEVSPKEFVRVPWRQKDKDAQKKKIEDWLQAPYSPPDEDDQIPRFEPI